MKLPFINQRAIIFVLILSIVSLFWLGADACVSAQVKLPKPSGHVNDFAAVLDAATRDRLEKILQNLEQRTGIEFVIATLKSTGSEDLYAYSLRIANDWQIGTPTSSKKSVLLAIAGDKGEFLAHISRGVRSDLPDGLIGDMGQRMRAKIESAGYGEGLLTGIKTFANGLGERNNFTFADLDQRPAEKVAENLIAEQERPRTVQSPAAQPTETPAPQPTATPAARATETPAPLPTETPKPEPSANVAPTAEPTPAVAMPQAPATPQPQPSEIPEASPVTAPATPLPTALPQTTDSPAAQASPSVAANEEVAANAARTTLPSVTDRKTTTAAPASPD
ncbi:MAG: uncharacterized protein QOF72_406, partial [Blastocatellia bacterium]|nr:uncharacterized protein [Blastocatellia bacterium]